MAIIEVNHITKEYRLGSLTSLKDTVLNSLNRLRGVPVTKRKAFKALNDIHFKIEAGEVVGIIGHNGAGKSTLLKILSGIVTPTTGSLRIAGRVAPLIEVGAGLIGDLTGRENIYVNATILGMKRKEINKKLDEIIAFAELEQFIDTPVKRYSSGMHVKLGFAIATAVDSEILIVDEVLAVGDIAFQRKCYDRVEQIIRQGNRTIILVSHNLRQVERLCSRALMLHTGQLTLDADPVTVCNTFFEQSNKKIVSTRANAVGKYESCPEFELLAIRLLDGQSETDHIVSCGSITVEVRFLAKTTLRNLNFTLGVHTTDLFFIGVTGSEKMLAVAELLPGEHTVYCHLHDVPLAPGAYAIHFGVEAGISNARLFRGDNLLTLSVTGPNDSIASASERLGVIKLSADWKFPGAIEAVI